MRALGAKAKMEDHKLPDPPLFFSPKTLLDFWVEQLDDQEAVKKLFHPWNEFYRHFSYMDVYQGFDGMSTRFLLHVYDCERVRMTLEREVDEEVPKLGKTFQFEKIEKLRTNVRHKLNDRKALSTLKKRNTRNG